VSEHNLNGLETDIDVRLRELWDRAFLWERSFTLSDLGVFIRAAYGLGYTDALKETPERRAELCREYGYQVPVPNDD